LKPDTLANVREISHSSHHVTMITGDNILTACHVASELKFIRKDNALLLTKENSNWFLKTVDDKVSHKLEDFDFKKNKKDNLCFTGEGFEYLYKNDLKLLKKIVSRIKVFARVSPKQKEQVITLLKSLGYVTLMCGDGTNDVGALKHSDVGVALLSNSDFEKKRVAKQKELAEAENTIRNNDPGQLQALQQQRVNRVNIPLTPQQQAVQNAQVCVIVRGIY
jgi:manganese-transporting P-type ATPase